MQEVRLGRALLCGLLPFARLSLRPILRELSFVVVLLPLAGRGRLPHFFDVRRLLLDAGAAAVSEDRPEDAERIAKAAAGPVVKVEVTSKMFTMEA